MCPTDASIICLFLVVFYVAVVQWNSEKVEYIPNRCSRSNRLGVCRSPIFFFFWGDAVAPPLGMGSVADPRNMLLPTCVTMPISVIPTPSQTV